MHTAAPKFDLDLTALVSDAHWLGFGFNPSQATLFFLYADDDLLENSVFIQSRWLHERPSIAYPLAEVIDVLRSILPKIDSSHDAGISGAPPTAPAPQGLILHTAFCCSTLFARCLQNPGVTRVLRELPLYSGMPRARAMLLERYDGPAIWHQLLEAAAALSYRRFAGELATFNKPSNAFLGAAGDFLSTATGCRGVLLHGDLPAFLLSCAKKIGQGRAPWLAMLAGLNPDPVWLHRSGIDPVQAHPMQLAALIWHAQMAMIHDLSGHACAHRLRHLDTETFLQDPYNAIAAAQTWLTPHLTTPMPRDAIDVALQRDSKRRDARFSKETRSIEARAVREHYTSALDDALAWSEKTFGAWEPAYRFDLQPLLAHTC